jgi:hypothetical protein
MHDCDYCPSAVETVLLLVLHMEHCTARKAAAEEAYRLGYVVRETPRQKWKRENRLGVQP